jgi:hypothetical protein
VKASQRQNPDTVLETDISKNGGGSMMQCGGHRFGVSISIELGVGVGNSAWSVGVSS